jgi:uncharacterized membrane protein YcaP (DUF421 family)
MTQIVEMLTLTQSVPEIVIRSVIGFLALLALIRIVPKRNVGRISPNDMLILIVVGTIGADAITGGSTSAGDLILMTAIVLGWGYLLDLLEYHVPGFRRLMRHEQTLLIKDGRFMRRNMRQELVTEEEMLSVMRLEGIASVEDVSSAVLEADGEISILKKHDRPPEKMPAPGAST